MRKILRFIRKFSTGHLNLIVCLLLQLVLAASSLITSEGMRRGIQAIENKSLDMLFSVAGFILIVSILNIALSYFSKVMRTKTELKYEQEIQSALLTKIANLNKLRFNEYKTGDVITIIVNNANEVSSNIIDSIYGIFTGTSVILACIIYMAAIDWKIMIAILLFNLVIRGIIRLFEKKVRQNATYAVYAQKSSNSFLFDILKNMITVRSFHKKDYFNNKLLNKEQHLLKANLKKHLWSNGLFEFIWTSSKIMEYVALYGFGGYLVFKGYSELSTIFAFVFIVEQIVSGLNTLASGVNGKSTAYALIDSIEEILNETQMENGENLNIPHDNFIIKAENISFAFHEKNILENISFRIDEKEKIMITGPNGQGKSTLLNIISGLLCPTSGKLSYGTQDITVVNLNSLSECYTYISQNNNILDGNIFENIALNRNYNVEKCNIILENLHLSEKKESKPMTLSQGEKQRVNISRALYKNDVCLILCDEIFSNIDQDNTTHIIRHLVSQFDDKTVIMVCHENINYPFDRVFHVNDGAVSIKEIGSASI